MLGEFIQRFRTSSYESVGAQHYHQSGIRAVSLLWHTSYAMISTCAAKSWSELAQASSQSILRPERRRGKRDEGGEGVLV